MKTAFDSLIYWFEKGTQYDTKHVNFLKLFNMSPHDLVSNY